MRATICPKASILNKAQWAVVCMTVIGCTPVRYLLLLLCTDVIGISREKGLREFQLNTQVFQFEYAPRTYADVVTPDEGCEEEADDDQSKHHPRFDEQLHVTDFVLLARKSKSIC